MSARKKLYEITTIKGEVVEPSISIQETSYASGDGKIITKKVKARVKALYPHVIELQLSNGLTRSPTYWELERLKAGGGTDGKECAGAVPGAERRDQGLT